MPDQPVVVTLSSQEDEVVDVLGSLFLEEVDDDVTARSADGRPVVDSFLSDQLGFLVVGLGLRFGRCLRAAGGPLGCPGRLPPAPCHARLVLVAGEEDAPPDQDRQRTHGSQDADVAAPPQRRLARHHHLVAVLLLASAFVGNGHQVFLHL